MRIADWFKKDIKIKVLAFLVALLFWLYVSNVTNPFKTITIYNVPVTEVNKDFLSQNNYDLKNQPRTFIDITIRGRQDVVEKVRSTDFEVYLDYSQIQSVNDKKLAFSEPVCLFQERHDRVIQPERDRYPSYQEEDRVFRRGSRVQRVDEAWLCDAAGFRQAGRSASDQ